MTQTTTAQAPRPHAIRCGSCQGTHPAADMVRACYTEARGGYLDARDAAAEMAAETWAENAWLRHAEGYYRIDPDEDRERMIEALGYGPPM